MSSDLVSTSFKLPESMDKKLPILAELSGFEGKSEYIRHLIQQDLDLQERKAALYLKLTVVNKSGISQEYQE